MVDRQQKKRITQDAPNESGQRRRFTSDIISGFEHAAPPPRRLTPASPPRRSTKEYGDLTKLREEVEAPPRRDSRSEGFIPPTAEDDVGESGIPTPRPKLPLGSVPRLAMGEAELRALPLDHRAGFVLAHIDGRTSMRTLLDVCGMSHDEIAIVLERLLALKAIVLR